MASTLPFQIGQLVESRCFLTGYRGAWFRCKIKDSGWRMGSLSYELEFVDFPDEEVVWTKPFQKPPAAFGIPSTGPKGQLMVRPQFPQVYREKQLSDVSTNSQLEVTVVVNDVWKVGDLVDWWKDNCYWSGKIIAVLGDEVVKIELLPPPFGEGLTYRASCKDLRPYLDWSPESGWVVPNMKVKGSTQCARVLKHPSGAENLSEGNVGKSHASSSAFQTTDSSMQPTHETARPSKRLCNDTASKEKHEDTPETNCGQSLKDMVPNVTLNSTNHGSLEAAILDMEELINRIKWIRRILDGGIALQNASGSPWKFLEHRPSSTPK